MQSKRAAVAGVGVLIVFIVLFIVLKAGGGSSSTTTPADDATVQTIVVKNAQPVGGVQDLTFTQGGRIRFMVKSDVADEVHFHGYDIGKDVKAGGQVAFDVPATITGVFEVELESRATQIAQITVDPA